MKFTEEQNRMCAAKNIGFSINSEMYVKRARSIRADEFKTFSVKWMLFFFSHNSEKFFYSRKSKIETIESE